MRMLGNKNYVCVVGFFGIWEEPHQFQVVLSTSCTYMYSGQAGEGGRGGWGYYSVVITCMFTCSNLCLSCSFSSSLGCLIIYRLLVKPSCQTHCTKTYFKGNFVDFFPVDFTLWNLNWVSFFWAGANLSVTGKSAGCTSSGSSVADLEWTRRVVTTGRSLASTWSSTPLSATTSTEVWISCTYALMEPLLPCNTG